MKKNKGIELPNEYQTEYLTLAVMMQCQELLFDGVDQLQSHDFFDSRHQAIFAALVALSKEDKILTEAKVWSWIEAHFPNVVEKGYLFDMYHCYATNRHDFEDSIGSLRNASGVRRQALVLTDILNSIQGKQTSSEAIRDMAIKRLSEIETEKSDKTQYSIEEVNDLPMDGTELSIDDFFEEQRAKYLRGECVYRGMPTGYALLDKRLSGICNGHYIIVAARPGVGKTTFCLNLMLKLALQDVAVGFFSIEMGKNDVLDKLAGIYAGVNPKEAYEGEMSDWDRDKFRQARSKIARLPIYLDVMSGISLNQIISRTKRLILNNNIKVLFIDYLGLITFEDKKSNYFEKVQEISKSLMGLAKSLNIPIICICQLNRKAAEETPSKHHLAESGQIERDAHTILLLDSTNEGAAEGCVKLRVNAAKNRFGPEGYVNFDFNPATGLIKEIDYRLLSDLNKGF